ncbi:MAG: protein kinase [Gemmatimonadota bacterium]|nr:protein kinase [Gemmatimonadota bacterium]
MNAGDTIGRLNAALEGRYRIERELGEGGMATVYLASDVRHDRQVALKVLRPELAEVVGADRFLGEIRTTASLQHPHILPLHDSGEADGLLFYVMPYVDGEALSARLEREGMLPLAEAVRVVRDVADALAGAHAQGVIHRDIKPANVLLSGRHAMVTDFGIAKALSEVSEPVRLTSVGVSLGTPHYMSPEQAAGDAEIDHRSDLYALGVLAYEVLLGEPPFTGRSLREILTAHLTRVPDRIRDRREGVPEELSDLVARCLEKEPDRRPESAAVVVAALERLSGGPEPGAVLPPTKSRRPYGWAAAAVAAMGALWLGTTLLPDMGTSGGADDVDRLRALADDGAWEEAYRLALAVEPGLDATVRDELWARFSLPRGFESDPPGATVFRKPYDRPDAEWEELGTTPFETRLPLGWSRIRATLEGYDPAEFNAQGSRGGSALQIGLLPEGTTPSGKVRVIGASVDLASGAYDLPSFFIDRYEVSNAEYREFVEAGGYEREELWTEPFVLDGRVIPWSEAIGRFRDSTGRPGPATWEVGDFPAGQGDHPVSGVSWYEAAAYARFRGEALPTIHEWERAAVRSTASYVIPRSNFGGEGIAARGEYDGLGLWGTQDMMGNVREWVYNESVDDRRYALGGGWSDPPYFATGTRGQMDPWSRDELTGFRLARRTEGIEELPPEAFAPFFEGDQTNLRDIEPAPDATYEAYASFFQYDPRPLASTSEAIDSTIGWVRETYTVDAAYDDQRLVVHVFRPEDRAPPYQPVLYWPGAAAQSLESIEQYMSSSPVDFLTKAGRAVVWPILEGTFERRGLSGELRALSSDVEVPTRLTIEARDWVIRQVQDMSRTVEFIRERDELDEGALTYFGFSWGAAFAPLVLTQVPGFRAAVFQVGGLYAVRWVPAVDPLNYVRRVTTPTLFMAGQFDMTFDLERQVRPFHELLGTPDADKRLYVSQGGHGVPRNEMIRETLDWLDRYVGPVR